MKQSTFSIKDLINVGLITLLIFIFTFISGMIGFFPVTMPIVPFVGGLITGPVFMLYFTKIHHFVPSYRNDYFAFICCDWTYFSLPCRWNSLQSLCRVYLKIGKIQRYRESTPSLRCLFFKYHVWIYSNVSNTGCLCSRFDKKGLWC